MQGSKFKVFKRQDLAFRFRIQRVRVKFKIKIEECNAQNKDQIWVSSTRHTGLSRIHSTWHQENTSRYIQSQVQIQICTPKFQIIVWWSIFTLHLNAERTHPYLQSGEHSILARPPQCASQLWLLQCEVVFGHILNETKKAWDINIPVITPVHIST